ncbi:MAG: hypothetical protein K0S16_1291 [Moraxellaceae bacterium]|nr:hypothetical protein [Moraxellaceae bacterium]
MKALWSLFWSVCQMRRGPEDMPWSPGLLLVVVLLNLLLGLVIQWLTEPVSLLVALGIALLALAVDAVALWLLLTFKHFELRYVQGLTTIYGVDFLLGLIALPLVALGSAVVGTPWLAVVVVAQMLLVGWNLGVRGFVYHRTLEIGIFQANMLSLTLFLLHIFLAAKLFPELLAAAPAR